MLHVFNVNSGRMLTFDVNLAMERVVELKNSIASTHGLHPDKQVMLISGGQALCDEERVCSYAAGTETNPVYLFDKACIEKESMSRRSEHEQDGGFSDSISYALSLQPCYQTVEARTKLAIRLNEATRRQVVTMKSLVHDEHLMYQGWQAAVANLQDTVAGFKNRVEMMGGQCQKLFGQGEKNHNIMKGLDRVIENLEKIPVLPALLKKGGYSSPLNSLEENSPVSLLRWIETQCKNISVCSMLKECKQKQAYLNQDKYRALVEDCTKIQMLTGNEKMSEISGINERLTALDNLLLSAEEKVMEQTRIAQGFVRNRETAKELHNNASSIDALLTLCESHITQLGLMHEHEMSARDALKKCAHAKEELAANLHARLRWLYVMQRSVLNADVKLSMFTQQLSHLQHQVTFLDQIQNCPTLYLASVTEVVRRKQFSSQYIARSNKALSDSQVERDREIVKRKTFQSNLCGHFIQRLFYGFSDKPPSLAKKPLRSFDNKLPNITPENIVQLKNLLPMYSEILEVPKSEKESRKFPQNMESVSDAPVTHPFTSMMDGSSFTQCGQNNSNSNVQSTNYQENTDVSVTTSKVEMEQKEQAPTGSFAVVPSPNVGCFVVTSVEEVTQENLQRGFPSIESAGHAESPPQRSYSSPAMAHGGSPPTSMTPSTRSDSVFAQIGDIISPDSPPDSEFYSIMPQNFSFPDKSPQIETQAPETSGIGKSFVQMSGKTESSFHVSKRQSMLLVGSPDSNTSNSYHKVDGVLSSDEEMFHSFTSDHGKDLKSTRKKLHQVQSEYDQLAEESRRDKEDLNTFIKKLQDKVVQMEENQRSVEADYERRWTETKSELENVIRQLEGERVERKKAWTEGANLEKNLKESSDLCRDQLAKIDMLEKELAVKKDCLAELESDFECYKENCTMEISEQKSMLEQKLSEVESLHQQEQETFLAVSTRLEKEIARVQSELAASDDRIQELETLLSEKEQKLEEGDIHTLELESEIKDLKEKLDCMEDSIVSKDEHVKNLELKISESEKAQSKAQGSINSLKNMLADYETKFNDDRTKEDQIKNLKSHLHQLELDKFQIETELKTSRHGADDLAKNLADLEEQMQTLRSSTMKDAKTHQEELENLRSSHQEDLSSSSARHQEEVKILTEEHADLIEKLQNEREDSLKEKRSEWEAEVNIMKNDHRNELDEIEADRLAAIADSQQTIEVLRSKVKELHRSSDQKEKDFSALQENLFGERDRLVTVLERLKEEKESLLEQKISLENELAESRDAISNLEREKRNESFFKSPLLASSFLTSSTDDEMESKRSKLDSGISEEAVRSFQSKQMDTSASEDRSDSGVMTMSINDHNHAIEIMRKNFEEDKKALQSLFKKREEEATRRRQMVFNSAIQRVTTSKDVEIQKLKTLLTTKSDDPPTLTQSMMVPSSKPMVTPTAPAHPSPPSSYNSSLSSSTITTAAKSPNTGAGKSDTNRDKDKVTVTNFQVGDTVLISYNEKYQHFTLLTTSHTLHFVHNESIEKLGINAAPSEYKRSMTLATLTEKEYCQARKAQNRFHVPISTKFYRVKVVPLSKKE